jgi:hypothetical protein
MARPQCDAPFVCKALLVRRFLKGNAPPSSSAVKSVAAINMYELSVLLSRAPTGTIIALDPPTFGSFSLLEPVSLVKVF